ncbi:DNA gyrase subunit A [Candidatus Uhrbacteria bacterium RIFCSPLOWO2_12_FULL_46_10]|uniref:DNA gyrase subunit A n=1 Tax=Candidatus Uhrbacteria bacterium RIFCSPLOWO2_01_FULL_47_25 TaxID=1802402 RepID=A0A1F7UZ75_9BACT|nr:MAG: gyrase subunit A protein [Parcubacteria group bacterium GW2011_GWA2_46_9]OGL59739.1 MAG: DNA gyrase subunit A [Candidatus Uhrbacteria bacterium RIFCSPHIGHO2_01_FULL_46_23]OGL70535.1 MAG: DNA gyrase subunit A [Candidatus Uhrbacteria bacterium RIFCSPHIGHO2_02_FULL_47_29]OGL75130.1 MAG: DNA gyrase subunit A [Candidatus Uhrbacteria bacterium RIFCSPHIGHO2_12_FULL_46_13]OGL83068.1 MAG: DNA gyrase subunit A [Candidatus Uhrbacteria bacterium RIFCSPLOWO2_01_FULL_47_25]OGL84157.1 MAG: DNA gyrase
MKISNTENQSNTTIGAVLPRGIVEEMSESYLDYAMSVIVSRALPDVRDGLKPVQRRILYAMWQMGLKSSAKFRKSATVVGEVLGKYHPHGDVAVYDAMVRMAQEFSLRGPLVSGQGNFGSRDGDSAAAMRYTEAKLSSLAEELLIDIDKETVSFVPNYDGTHEEPRVLPGKLPGLLLNGTMGIAVGMATSIPPHNLGELVDGIVYLIDNPEATTEDLVKFIPGPDFPTGAVIYDVKEIHQAYGTGKGAVLMRGVAAIEEDKNGQWCIVITAIPYQVNKAEFVSHIADLVHDKKIEGIKDLRDESDRDGVRVVIDLKKDSYPKKILNQLYKSTELQQTFHMNMLALVDGVQPRVLNLKTVLEEHIKHRQTVIRRRTEYDLGRAKERAHILKGLKIAVDNIDAVIKTIKQSADKDEARGNLMRKFSLTERQAVAILEMRLQQLANLERLKIEQELKEKLALSKELEALLSSPKKILGVIKSELLEMKKRFPMPRLTTIVPEAVGEFRQEDLIPNEPTVVVITHDGYVKRLPPETFRTQSRGGKGVMGLTTKEEDMVEHFFVTTTHADLLFFTTRGRVFQLKAYEVPAGSRTSKGQAIVNFLQLAPGESVTSVLPFGGKKTGRYFVMGTTKGMIKKVSYEHFANVRRSGLIAMRLKSGDALKWVMLSSGQDEIMIITKRGQAIRFKEKGVREMGREASGVRAIRIKSGDEVVSLSVVPTTVGEIKELELIVVSENGFGKRTKLTQYKVQGRGGSGVKTMAVTKKTGEVVGAIIARHHKGEAHDIILISTSGQVIRLPYDSVSVLNRVTQGVRLMRFRGEKDRVASITIVG